MSVVYYHDHWRPVFIWQFFVPIGVVIMIALYTSVNSGFLIPLFVRRISDGEIILIAILLMIATYLELTVIGAKGDPRNRTKPKKKSRHLADFGLAAAFLSLILYTFNKTLLNSCETCNGLTLQHYVFLVVNLIYFFVGPLFSIAMIKPTIERSPE